MSSQTKCVVMPKPNHKPKGETAMSANHTAVNEYRNLPISRAGGVGHQPAPPLQ